MFSVRSSPKTERQAYEFAYEIFKFARPFLMICLSKKVLESYPEQKYGILNGDTLCKTCTEIMILFYGSLLVRTRNLHTKCIVHKVYVNYLLDLPEFHKIRLATYCILQGAAFRYPKFI